MIPTSFPSRYGRSDGGSSSSHTHHHHQISPSSSHNIMGGSTGGGGPTSDILQEFYDQYDQAQKKMSGKTTGVSSGNSSDAYEKFIISSASARGYLAELCKLEGLRHVRGGRHREPVHEQQPLPHVDRPFRLRVEQMSNEMQLAHTYI